jgi:hypothetical protein
MKEEIRSWRKEMKARREAMMEACIEKKVATDLETNP